MSTTALPRTSGPVTLPRPVEQSVPPWLLTLLGSTWDLCPCNSSGVLRPSVSTLVHYHSIIAMDFRTFGCTSSLHPNGSCGLLLLSSSTLILGRSAFSSVFQSPGYAPVAHHCSYALPSRTFDVAGPINSSASPRVSTTIGSICQASSMTPPYNSAMGLHPGPSAGDSTLAPPTFVSTLAQPVPYPCSPSHT